MANVSIVQEPVLFVWVFLPKTNQPDVYQKITALAAKNGLKAPIPKTAGCTGITGTSVGPALLRDSTLAESDLLNRQEVEPRKTPFSLRGNYELLARFEQTSPQGGKVECLLHAYHDTLVVQIAIGKDRSWKGTFVDGFDELTEEFNCQLRDSVLIEEKPYGTSAVYWAIVADGVSTDSYSEQMRVIDHQLDLPGVSNDLGQLCRSKHLVFPGLDISQDLWLLLTPRSAESEVNRRFNQPFHDAPPTFATMALAAHKIRYEEREHASEINGMEGRWKNIDQQVSDALRMQQESGSRLENLRSIESEKLGRQLAMATAALAGHRNSVNVLKRLRRTIGIDRRNFLVNGVELISAKGKTQVEGSPDWENAALALLSSLGEDRIFFPEAGHIQAILEQLDSDIDYGESVCEAHTASLCAVSDQLRIAGERHLGEMAHHLSIDSAAVVASLVAVILVETVLRGAGFSVAVWFLLLFWVVGAFGATQLLSSRGRGGWLERTSLALAGGCLGGYLILSFEHWRNFWKTLRLVPTATDTIRLIVVFLAMTILVALVHWLGAKRRSGR